MSRPALRILRVYDVLDTSPEDGELRVLVDRLWPRGIRRDRLHGTWWWKEATASHALRRALHSGEIEQGDFAARYRRELDASGAAQQILDRASAADARCITLLVAARDVEGSHAHVLARALADALSEKAGGPSD